MGVTIDVLSKFDLICLPLDSPSSSATLDSYKEK